MEIKQENYQTMYINSISKSDFSKVCRTCLTMEENLSFENAAEFFSKLNISFGFEFSLDDILPKGFCTGCTEKINIIYEFKRLCLYTEQILKNAMTDDPVNIKIEQDTKTEYVDLIEPKSYDSAIDSDDIKVDTDLLTPNIDLKESQSDEDITEDPDDTKAYTVKEENDPLDQTVTKESLSLNVTNLFNQHVAKLEGDGGYRCNLCGKESKLRCNMRKHVMLHIPKEQRVKYCKICKKRYTRKDSYLKHLKQHEKDILEHKVDGLEEVKIYQCSECQRLFETEEELEKHKFKHYVEKFKNSAQFANNKAEDNSTETDVKAEKKHKCPQCSKSFDALYNLRRHIHTHIPAQQREKYCLYCDKRYINQDKYQRHMKLHKNIKSAIIKPKIPCELCGKSVTSLPDHMRNVHRERKYQCPECDQKFFHEFRLKRHINIVHRNMKVKKHLLCPQCGKTFGSYNHFQCHLADHEGRKLYKCDICNLEFKFDSPYRKHMNKYHYNNVVKNFSCEYCGKKFVSRQLVQNHLVVHTGEKPYACKVCDRRVSHRGALWTHMKTHNVQK